MIVVWITANPRAADTGEAVTVRLAGGGRSTPFYRSDLGEHFRAGAAGRPRFTAKLDFGDDGWNGATLPTTGSITFKPADKALLGELAGRYWRDAPIAIEAGEEGGPYTTLLNGTIAGATAARNGLELQVSDLSTAMGKPLVNARFAGSGGAEGGAEASGRVKRRSWGRVFNVEGLVLDKASNIYEFGDPGFPLQAIDVLRDLGREADPAPSTIDWQGSVAATLAALKAADCVDGSGAVAPSIACAKWWTQPAGPFTADLRGEVGDAYVETAPEIAERILATFGPIILNNADDMADARPAPCGIHIGDASETIAQALDRLLLGVSLLWILEPDGSASLREWTFDDPVETIRSIDVTRKSMIPPMSTRRVGYQKSYRIHSASEIAAPILESAFIQPEAPDPDTAPSGATWYDLDDGLFAYTRTKGSGELAFGGIVISFGGVTLSAAWTPADGQQLHDSIENAQQALDLLAPFADDDQLDTTEKKALVTDVATLTASVEGLLARGGDLGISDETDDLSTAWGAFLAMLAAIDPPYTSTNLPSDIDRGTFNATRAALDEALAAMSGAISSRDSYRADKLVPPASQTIQYDYTGTTTTQLPKVLQFRLLRGSDDITADTTFDFSAAGATIDATGLDPGQVSLETVTAANGTITCTATPPEGTPQQVVVALQRVLGQNPGGSGGGGSGATSFSVSVSATITDTSYDGSPQPLFDPPAEIRANGSGQIRLVLNAEYEISLGTAQLFAKWQKSTDGGTSWADVSGGSMTGSTATGGHFNTPPGEFPTYENWVDPVPGAIAFNSLITDFTAGTDVLIRAIGYKSGTGGGLGVSGTASGAQS